MNDKTCLIIFTLSINLCNYEWRHILLYQYSKKRKLRRNVCGNFKTAEKTIIEKKFSFAYKRIVQRQTCRENVPSDTLEEYYRRSIYIPLLDALILDINTRFSKENVQCLQIYSLMPENIIKLNHKGVLEIVSVISNVYGTILGLSNQHLPALELISEVELW